MNKFTKFAIRILIGSLDLFTNIIISKISSAWVKRSAELAIKRLKLFGEALVDADPDNATQLETIARETLISPEFQDFEHQLTLELVEKIPNAKLGKVLLDTENLRTQFFAVLGDADKDNGAQLKVVLDEFVKSEEFDATVITFAELFADKYVKNDVTRLFFLNLITGLVNSDDNN